MKSEKSKSIVRDHHWLVEQLEFLLGKYFAGGKITNPIEIKFGREAKYRFGSIRLVEPRGWRKLRGFRLFRKLRDEGPKKSIITITSLFTKLSIPVKVVQYTIAHELCHYFHGFSSANKRLFKYPHHGGVVNRELKERGAQDLVAAFKKWLKEYRASILVS